MDHNNRSLVIDAGNTRIKAAVFHAADLEEVHSFSKEQLNELKAFIQQHGHLPAIIASVKADKDTRWLKQLAPKALLFKTTMRLPLKIAYDTPETLGADRLCNAIAAFAATESACLVVDIGTCVKYDLTDDSGTYLGGAISPGMSMRFQAMHTFTGKLPLIEDSFVPAVLGKNTLDAMRSGVMHGILNEISGFIASYRTQFPRLRIFLTGGDAQNFDLGHINGIFADENLTLKGLQITLANYGS